ncbi:protein translocase subunit secB [Mariprofundus ferrinatatus]|uniref:Protein translocase subunit secB n=1 Tax=Mariprofundus ferrinatatus TaxID=1921087 RepID=A0A2K8L834_9PROT|nr:protein-export chaperone SecB [Mariprofundus ferrinatatus]ATX82021.1 protein translocase subunit secB [Mariprofundus ferrinatatus]
MTDIDTTTPDENTPVFSLQKLYTRDISFENPNAPFVFAGSMGQPKIDMNLSTKNRQIDAEHCEVTIKVSAQAHDTENDKLLFEVEVEYAGLFYMKNIPEEHLEILLGVDCPATIFPYVRQLISQLTGDGGFIPLMLDPVNFSAAFEHNRQQIAAQEKAAETTH